MNENENIENIIDDKVEELSSDLQVAQKKVKKASYAIKRKASPSRKLTLSKKYFPYDEENNIFEVDLHYESGDDLLDSHLSREHLPYFSHETYEEIDELLDRFPNDTYVNIDFTLKEVGTYTPVELLDAFNDGLEMQHYRGDREDKRRRLRACILVLAGISILIVLAFAKTEGWLGDLNSFHASLWSEVFDIAAWVFIWEAVSTMFLSPSEAKVFVYAFSHKVNQIAFYRESDDAPILIESKESALEQWDEEKMKNKIGKQMLLISGAVLMGLGLYGLFVTVGSRFEQVTNVSASSFATWQIALFKTISIVCCLLQIYVGLTGFAICATWKKLSRSALYAAIPLATLNCAIVILILVFGLYGFLFHFLASLFALFIYGIGWTLWKLCHRKS